MPIKCDFCVHCVPFASDDVDDELPGGDAVCVSPTMVAVGTHRSEWPG